MTAAASSNESEGLVPALEADDDRHETLIQYEPTSKVPFTVILVWICAIIGLAAYMVTLYLPELALWGKP